MMNNSIGPVDYTQYDPINKWRDLSCNKTARDPQMTFTGPILVWMVCLQLVFMVSNLCVFIFNKSSLKEYGRRLLVRSCGTR